MNNVITVRVLPVWEFFNPIYIGFFMFNAKELIQNSILVLTKNIKSILIPCFMPNHIKYMHNNFTCLVQDQEVNFVSASPMFFPMFWHQTLINPCSVRNGGSFLWTWSWLTSSIWM